MLNSVGVLAAGGLVGTFARAGFSSVWNRPSAPWGTFVVNMIGCFLIGLFDVASERRGWGPHGRLLLMTGFCGAFTTFSSLILEVDGLLRSSPGRAAAYLLVSVAAGLLLLRAGALAGSHV